MLELEGLLELAADFDPIGATSGVSWIRSVLNSRMM